MTRIVAWYRLRKLFARRHDKAHCVKGEAKLLVKNLSNPIGFDIIEASAGDRSVFNLVKHDEQPSLEKIEGYSVHVVVPRRYLANRVTIILAEGPEVKFVRQSEDLIFVQFLWPIEENVAIN